MTTNAIFSFKMKFFWKRWHLLCVAMSWEVRCTEVDMNFLAYAQKWEQIMIQQRDLLNAALEQVADYRKQLFQEEKISQEMTRQRNERHNWRFHCRQVKGIVRKRLLATPKCVSSKSYAQWRLFRSLATTVNPAKRVFPSETVRRVFFATTTYPEKFISSSKDLCFVYISHWLLAIRASTYGHRCEKIGLPKFLIWKCYVVGNKISSFFSIPIRVSNFFHSSIYF